jgi:hypothetical protein
MLTSIELKRSRSDSNEINYYVVKGFLLRLCDIGKPSTGKRLDIIIINYN